jgi:phage-related protein
MAKKKNEESWIEELINLILILGGIYLIYKVFFGSNEEKEEVKSIYGIHGPKDHVRIFRGLELKKEKVFYNDLILLDRRHITQAINVISHSSKAPELKGSFVKFFKDDIITGELIKDQIRIFFYQKNKTEFYLVSIFLKQSDETGEHNKEKARKRIKQFIQQST